MQVRIAHISYTQSAVHDKRAFVGRVQAAFHGGFHGENTSDLFSFAQIAGNAESRIRRLIFMKKNGFLGFGEEQINTEKSEEGSHENNQNGYYRQSCCDHCNIADAKYFTNNYDYYKSDKKFQTDRRLQFAEKIRVIYYFSPN